MKRTPLKRSPMRRRAPRRALTSRQKLAQYEERLSIHARDHGICRTCKLPVSVDDFEVAHLIANTKANRAHWGNHVIDHPKNKATTHRGACNDGQNIGFNPMAAQALADEIRGEGAR